MAKARPNFLNVWNYFSKINVPVQQVGEIIEGYVKINIDSGVFQNACPIRLSYVLNQCGVTIPSKSKYATVSGEDGQQYIYGVNDMIHFLETESGKPDLFIKSPKSTHFKNKKGIIAFTGNGWSNARGHVTLWNGVVCSDACHFLGSDENGTFVPEVAKLWSLT